MKKLIKLSDTHYIVVDDSKINEGDWFYNQPTNYVGRTIKKEGNFWVCEGIGGFHLLSNVKKITHSTQMLESIYNAEAHEIEDGSFRKIKPLSLSEVEEATNGYSVETMASDNWDSQDMKYKDISEPWDFSFGYHQGFKAAIELTKDKLFTVGDMKNMFILGGKHKVQNFDKYLDIMDEIIQSLLPKTEWDIELIDGKINLI